MTKFLAVAWLLLSALIVYEAFKTIYSIMFLGGWSLDSLFALSIILIFAAMLSYINFIFLWRRVYSLLVCAIAFIFLLYFMALFLMGESEGIYRLLISLPGMTLCVATMFVSSKSNTNSL